MTDKRIYRLVHDEARRRAAEDCRTAPDGWIVRVSPPTRNLEQSAKFHAICAAVSCQKEWVGRKLSPYQWKVLFISGHAVATGYSADIVPGIEGEFANIRESSASMSKPRFSSLLEYVIAFCEDNAIIWDKRKGECNADEM